MVRENKTECKMTFRNEEPHVNKCFPRVRGDVPHWQRNNLDARQFSPRARGCSYPEDYTDAEVAVFPACAGMFPGKRQVIPADYAFSPRARGCSRHRRAGGIDELRFPRVRGDVPPHTTL